MSLNEVSAKSFQGQNSYISQKRLSFAKVLIYKHSYIKFDIHHFKLPVSSKYVTEQNIFL